MFDTIILLAEASERVALASLLSTHNPNLTILTPQDKAGLAAIPPDGLARSRLLGFLTPIVVPGRVLDALGYGAYNVHPGPPHYPGWLPSHFAVLDGARDFGATVHVMTRKVDAGPIVGIDLFAVAPGTTVPELERATFMRCARLVWHFAAALACDPAPLPRLPLRWSGRRSTKAMMAAACDIHPGMGKDEVDRRISVFAGGPCTPTVTLHGHTFRYVPPEDAPAADPAREASDGTAAA